MKLLYEDLVIVGFNAEPEAECGYAVAVAKDKRTGLHYRLSFLDAELALLRPDSDLLKDHSGQETSSPDAYPITGNGAGLTKSFIEKIRDEHRITLFDEGVEFSASHNVMVLYVAEPLLAAAGLELKSSPLLKDYDWELLSERPYKRWVTCATVDSIFKLLNYCGKVLENTCITWLVDYFMADEKKKSLLTEAKRCADLALCSARDQILRSDLYLFYTLTVALSTTPQRVPNVFKLTIQPKFPNWEWSVFNEQLKCLVDALRLRARAELPLPQEMQFDPDVVRDNRLVSKILSTIPARREGRSKLRSRRELIEKIVSEAKEVESLRDEMDKIEKAVEIAKEHRRLEPPDPAVEAEMLEIVKTLDGTDEIPIDDVEKLKVFAADPILYLSNNTTNLEQGSLLAINLFAAVEEYYASYIGRKKMERSNLAAMIMSEILNLV